jgi:hypothetical protein
MEVAIPAKANLDLGSPIRHPSRLQRTIARARRRGGGIKTAESTYSDVTSETRNNYRKHKLNNIFKILSSV